jgi:hypothetical protein
VRPSNHSITSSARASSCGRPSPRLQAEAKKSAATICQARDQARPQCCRPIGPGSPGRGNGESPPACTATRGIEKHRHVRPANGGCIDGTRYSNAEWSEMAWADRASDDRSRRRLTLPRIARRAIPDGGVGPKFHPSRTRALSVSNSVQGPTIALPFAHTSYFHRHKSNGGNASGLAPIPGTCYHRRPRATRLA